MPARPNPLQKIPENARLVFQGQLFEVYQWEQRLYDGTTATFEALKRPDTAYIIPVLADGMLLIAWQRQPLSEKRMYGLIGGRVERGEAPMAAAIRELREEAGLVARDMMTWEAFQFLPKLDWAIYTYIARGCTEVTRSLDPGEDIKLVKVTFEDFLGIIESDEFVDVEIALRLLRCAANPIRRRAIKSLFSPLGP